MLRSQRLPLCTSAHFRNFANSRPRNIDFGSGMWCRPNPSFSTSQLNGCRLTFGRFQGTLCTTLPQGPVLLQVWALRTLPRHKVPEHKETTTQRWQANRCFSTQASPIMHVLARVCFFRIGPQAAYNKSGKSTPWIAFGDVNLSVPAGSVVWQVHWDIGPL